MIADDAPDLPVYTIMTEEHLHTGDLVMRSSEYALFALLFPAVSEKPGL